MNRILLAALVAALALAAPAYGAAYLVDVPAEFASQLEDVKSESGLDVYLPSKIRTNVRASRLYGDASAEQGSYSLDLGVGRNCNGANACSVAYFLAARGEEAVYRTRVSLRGGRTGRFKPLTCGGSCSPPAVQWVEDGVLYEIQYKGASAKKEKATLIKLANSAIGKGPR
jgi:hypothetical protein